MTLYLWKNQLYIYIDLGLDPESNSIIEKVTVTRPFGNFKLTEEELDQIAEELPIDRDLLETFNPYDDYDGPVVFDKCVKQTQTLSVVIKQYKQIFNSK